MMSVTCHNLELRRTKLDFVAFSGCSNALLCRFSLRNSTWGLLRNINTVYRSRKVQCFHGDISHWNGFSTTMPNAFLGANHFSTKYVKPMGGGSFFNKLILIVCIQLQL